MKNIFINDIIDEQQCELEILGKSIDEKRLF